MKIETGFDSILDYIDKHAISMYRIPGAGTYESTPLYYTRNGDLSERINPNRLYVECPACEEEHCPLCSDYTEKYDSGWTWVGVSHKEPYTQFVARCTNCKIIYKFKLQHPQ